MSDHFSKKINNFLAKLNILKTIRIFALVGPSGTGKSFRARLVADSYHIRYFLDDGILVRDQKILAGRSAKHEPAYLAAVKTALYDDESHRREIRYVIEKSRPKKLLILGTSDRMIFKICEHLGLPRPFKIIRIEEIASEEDINRALESRKHEGRHVIPLPSREVRRNAPSIIDDSIKVYSNSRLFKKERMYEKTIVRPAFAPRDSLQIERKNLLKTIRQTIHAHIEGVRIAKITSDYKDGYEIDVLILPPEEANFAIDEVQAKIRIYMEKKLGIFIRRLNLLPLRVKHKQINDLGI